MAPHSVSICRALIVTHPVGADIDQRHQDVVADLYNWGVWIHSTLGDSAAGFRFDAIKHIDEDFITGFIKHVRQETGQPNLFAVGEFWSQSLEDICRYLDGFGTQVKVARGSGLLMCSSNVYSLVSSMCLCITSSSKPDRMAGTSTLEAFGIIRSSKRDLLMQCMCTFSLPELLCLLFYSTIVDNHE